MMPECDGVFIRKYRDGVNRQSVLLVRDGMAFDFRDACWRRLCELPGRTTAWVYQSKETPYQGPDVVKKGPEGI